MKRLGNIFDVGAMIFLACQSSAFAEWSDGSWKIGNENAIFKLQGNSALMITHYNGCTEISPMNVDYSADRSTLNLRSRGPMHVIPDGCTGGSAPFVGANASGIHTSSLVYSTEGENPVLRWNHTYSHRNDASRAYSARAIPEDQISEVLSLPYQITNADAADLDRIDEQGSLIRAARNGNKHKVAQLIAARANVNSVNQRGSTPLMAAAGHGHSDIVAQLITARANVNQADHSGWTPLKFAASNGNPQVISQLVAAGAEVNHVDEYGNNILYGYSITPPTIRHLVSLGANLNHVNSRGRTPLINAVMDSWNDGYSGRVAQLVSLGADLNVRDDSGKTALDLANEDAFRINAEVSNPATPQDRIDYLRPKKREADRVVELLIPASVKAKAAAHRIRNAEAIDIAAVEEILKMHPNHTVINFLGERKGSIGEDNHFTSKVIVNAAFKYLRGISNTNAIKPDFAKFLEILNEENSNGVGASSAAK